MSKKEKYIKIKHYKNSTYYTVQFSYESMGKKCTYSKTFHTMKEAVQHRDIKRAELITQGLPTGARTVIQLLEDHIDISSMACTTAKRKRAMLNHIPELQDVPIAKLTPLDIQRSLNSMVYDCSQSEINSVVSVLRAICNTAILEGHLTVSPMGRVVVPTSKKITVSRPKTVSDDEIEQILAELDSHEGIQSTMFNYKILRCFLEVMMYTGMRPSEVQALKRSNVHFDTLSIDVVSRIGSDEISTGVETRLKTEASRRTVPMSSACAETFRELFDMSDNEYLFTMWGGRILYESYINTTLAGICKKLGIYFHPYMLRHRAATKIIVEGKADPRTAMEILGHSSIQTTLNVYSHSNSSEKIRVINLVENSRKPS